MSLRRDVIGTWSLIGYDVDFEDGTHQSPYGPSPIGLLHYGADGFMCIHMMAPDRPLLNCDSNIASGDAARTALATHVSYAGFYRLDGRTITHTITICTLQDMVGLEVPRTVELNGSQLVLRAAEMTFGGKRGSAALVWRRAEASKEGNPT